MTALVIEGEILKILACNGSRGFSPIAKNPRQGIKVRPENLLKLLLTPGLDFVITYDGNVSNSVITEAVEDFLRRVEISIAAGTAPCNISQYESQLDIITFLIVDDPVNGSLELCPVIRISADMRIRDDCK